MRKMRLTEGRRVQKGKEIKYLGEGIVGVYERGKLVERFQLEKGDNLLEGLKKLTEDRYMDMKGPSYGAKGYWNAIDGSTFYLGSEDGEWFIYAESEDGDTLWTAYFGSESDAKKAGEKAAASMNPAREIEYYADDFIEN